MDTDTNHKLHELLRNGGWERPSGGHVEHFFDYRQRRSVGNGQRMYQTLCGKWHLTAYLFGRISHRCPVCERKFKEQTN